MRYRIILINTETGKRAYAPNGFTSRKKAEEFATAWKSQGKPFDCEVIDTKK